MTLDERARKLVGDVPWITDHLSVVEILDLKKQVQTCLEAAVTERLWDVLKLLVYEDDGRWFTGIHGDSDVTDIVGEALKGNI